MLEEDESNKLEEYEIAKVGKKKFKCGVYRIGRFRKLDVYWGEWGWTEWN